MEEEEGLDTAAAMQEDRDPGLDSLEQVMLPLDERLFGLVDVQDLLWGERRVGDEGE